MIFLPLARCTAATLLAASLPLSAYGQATPATPPTKNSIELQDEKALDADKVKLDPTMRAADLPGNPNSSTAPVEAPLPIILGLEKLSEADRKTVTKGIADVAGFMRGVRLQESLEKLNEIEKLTGDFHIIVNMRGAVFTKMRDFKAARTEFEKAIALTKDMPRENFHPRFNLAEINFVEKKWAQASKSFADLIATATIPDPGTKRLMEYKIMICQLQEKQNAAAMTTFEKFDQYDNDSPAFYFGKAAAAFSKDQKEEAEEWLASATKIYPKELNDVYQDSLVEVGWLQTLQ